MGSLYELSLKSNYVKEWGLNDALRELFQNSYDQEQVSGKKASYIYDVGSRSLRIINPHSWLDRATLLLGETTKDENADTIGQFGEGYKLACLVLCRLGLKVTIENQNYGEVWEASLRKSRRYNNREILVFNINGRLRFKHHTEEDLVFVVTGLSFFDWERYKAFNLNISDPGKTIKTSKGTILLEEIQKGNIYSGGLYVGTMDDLAYGYNFNPGEVPLDRDRRTLPTFDVLLVTSKMWAEDMSGKIIKLFEDNAPDVKYCSKVKILDQEEMKEEAAKSFFEKKGINTYPVATDRELDLLRRTSPELKPVLVSNHYRDFLLSTGKFQNLNLEENSLISVRLCNWLTKVEDRLTEEEIQEFNEIVKYVWN